MNAFVAGISLASNVDGTGLRWPTVLETRSHDRTIVVLPERLFAHWVPQNLQWLFVWWVRDTAGAPLVDIAKGIFVFVAADGVLRRAWDALNANQRSTLQQLRDDTSTRAVRIKDNWGDYRPRDIQGNPVGPTHIIHNYTVGGYDHATAVETANATEIATATPVGEEFVE